MAEFDLYLFDDTTARSWAPFALTRPTGELMLGAYTMRRRAELLFGAACRGHITAAHLEGFEEDGAPPAIGLAAVDETRPRLFLSARAVPAWGSATPPVAATATLRLDGAVVGCMLPAGTPNPEPDWFLQPAAVGGDVPLDGELLGQVWELVSRNPAQLRTDVDCAIAARGASRAEGVHVIGRADGALLLGDGVTIEPGVVLDFTGGPIWLDDNVTVRAFTRLSGPAYVGPGSTLLGGPYTTISVGPVCKLHGELEETVVLGYSNKAHDGFIGHAYLGRWVNLGALTTNSDLKNNYGTIRMWTPAGDANTGLTKLGCLLGDHVKTGIGSLLNTGTVLGAGTNVFGSEMPPKYVPPFSWGSGSDFVAFEEERFLALAETVMRRRSVDLSDAMRDVLRAAWRIGRESA